MSDGRAGARALPARAAGARATPSSNVAGGAAAATAPRRPVGVAAASRSLAGLAIGAALGIYLLVRRSHSNGSSPRRRRRRPCTCARRRRTTPTGRTASTTQQAPLATDGTLGTVWQTESYHDAPSLGKPGVGLVLDAGTPVQLHRITVVTSTPGLHRRDPGRRVAGLVPRRRLGDRRSIGRTHRFDLIAAARTATTCSGSRSSARAFHTPGSTRSPASD